MFVYGGIWRDLKVVYFLVCKFFYPKRHLYLTPQNLFSNIFYLIEIEVKISLQHVFSVKRDIFCFFLDCRVHNKPVTFIYWDRLEPGSSYFVVEYNIISRSVSSTNKSSSHTCVSLSLCSSLLPSKTIYINFYHRATRSISFS